jgi:hypothetical protein
VPTLNLDQNQAAAIKNLYQSLKGTANPLELMKAQMANNPAFQKTMEQIQAAGGDPQKALMNQLVQNQINQNGMMQMINQIQNICL